MPVSKLSFSIIFFEKSTGRRNYDLIHKVKEKIEDNNDVTPET
jgi:hypothetical protein